MLERMISSAVIPSNKTSEIGSVNVTLIAYVDLLSILSILMLWLNVLSTCVPGHFNLKSRKYANTSTANWHRVVVKHLLNFNLLFLVISSVRKRTYGPMASVKQHSIAFMQFTTKVSRRQIQYLIDMPKFQNAVV